MDLLNVDMMSEARNAQWSADEFLGAGAVRLVAPAKVNLFLGVGESDAESGYHKVTNVMHALALHDEIYAHRAPCLPEEVEEARAAEAEGSLSSHTAVAGPLGNLLISIDMACKAESAGAIQSASLDVPANENLAFKAIDALACEIGYDKFEKISLRIEKRIPHQAGLGGGSSDAAASIVAAAHFWGLPTDGPAVHRAASKVGADVSFFLYGGCARFTGVGEILECALEPAKYPVVLVKPPCGVSTGAAYAEFDENPEPVPSELLSRANNAERAADVPLFNNLAFAAESLAPDLVQVSDWLCERQEVVHVAGFGAVRDRKPQVLLTGSGACTYAICTDFAAATKVAAAAKRQGWWARATTLSSLRSALIG